MSSDRIVKPTDPDALILEAWGQGFMVGSLLIMAAITMANMKSHIMLHKLIFAEVSEFQGCISSVGYLLITCSMTAHPCCGSWHLYFPPPTSLWLVSQRHGHRPQYQLGPT
jgi:hypothetical protein